jgi:para-nitrobenzyl esterase
MSTFKFIVLAILLSPLAIMAQVDPTLIVKTADGTIEGVKETSTVRSFKGIPFAKPPVGELRWKEPQPADKWTDIKKADKFGANAMQKQPFGDMGFRSSGMSEDCLYLNVWAPANPTKKKLPVLVYFYGGGFVAGDASERRYDGEKMALQGIVTLTVNYRLGAFGFMAHPELTKESPNHASGNYGLLDQNAALRWVQANIAAFGGDPSRVTIAGESAGSISVFAQMASPLSKSLIAGAIGESGAMINPTLAAIPLEQGENNGVALAAKLNSTSLAALRALPASAILEESTKPGAFRTAATIDGYFLPKSPTAIFEEGAQAKVPLLAGWNSAEVPYQALLGGDAPTLDNYKKKLEQLYGKQSEEVLKLYPAATDADVVKSATALASDRFIAYSTWKWLDLQLKTGGKPVYRYLFSKSKPPLSPDFANTTSGLAGGVNKAKATDVAKSAAMPVSEGAPHAFEIEYAMGNLATNPMYAWTKDDYKVSGQMLLYFANFIKAGDPNGKGLPLWSKLSAGASLKFINLGVETKQQVASDAPRYLFLDQIYNAKVTKN